MQDEVLSNCGGDMILEGVGEFDCDGVGVALWV